jgi:hypothetical protein
MVEAMSPSGRLAAQRKMKAWLANGVELAWLAGEGPVEGFTLALGEIREGL